MHDYQLSNNDQDYYLKILEREAVAFDKNKPGKLSYKKLMQLKMA